MKRGLANDEILAWEKTGTMRTRSGSSNSPGSCSRCPGCRFKAELRRRIAEIADDLGLTSDQLGDRLVPDLGLDASGTLELDYGLGRFTAGFDEQLKPYVPRGAATSQGSAETGTKGDDELAGSGTSALLRVEEGSPDA